MLPEEVYRIPDIAFCTDTSAELFVDNGELTFKYLFKCITFKC